MNAARTVWHDILQVWTFFTRIPVPDFKTERTLAQAIWAMPLAAIGLAGVQICIFFSIELLVGSVAYADFLLSFGLVLAPIIATGALHWDGLADLADGLGVEPERRTAVMRNPHIGTFGVLALLAGFVLQVILYAALIEMLEKRDIIVGLVVISILSRQTMVFFWAFGRDTDGKNKMALSKPNVYLCSGLLMVSGVMFCFSGAATSPIFLSFPIFLGFWHLGLNRWLSSASGDSLGATQVLTETILLLLMVLSHVQ